MMPGLREATLIPAFILFSPTPEVSVTASTGTSVLTVQATDEDSGNYGEVRIVCTWQLATNEVELIIFPLSLCACIGGVSYRGLSGWQV